MIEQQPISFKDPAGYVFEQDNNYYRIISSKYKAEYDHLMESGLYRLLVEKQLLIPHQEVVLKDSDFSAYKVLLPEQIKLVSYPYEWSNSQWQQVIINFIIINKISLEHGMILKDATPFNFTFQHDKCLLIDTASFEFHNGEGPWIAYRQFCMEMLAPFLLMHYNDPVWPVFYRTGITGFPLTFVSKNLPFKSYFNLTCLLHIHLHARFENKTLSTNPAKPGINRQKLKMLLDNLLKPIRHFKQHLNSTNVWSDYYSEHIESTIYIEDKTAIITQWLDRIRPVISIDIGANTGKFSMIAANFSSSVYAIDNDSVCVNNIRADAKDQGVFNINTIIADIAAPTPGLGWNNEEKRSLLKRMKGDMLLALALIHHLCLTRDIPIQFIAKLFSTLTSKFAIVEFIPKSDSKAQVLLQRKEDIFDNYCESEFIRCFEQYFKLADSHLCEGSNRKLFLWERK